MNVEALSRLESLAKLSLSEEEKQSLCASLQGLLSLCDTLSELPQQEDSPTEASASFVREDVPAPCLTKEEALQNAPKQKDGFFVI